MNLISGLILWTAAVGQPSAGKPQAVVDILPSVAAIAPGTEFQLALRFKLTPKWHIYWMDPGDAGLPPSVKWEAPEGFEFGPLQYPVPTRHSAPGPLSTNILEGEPILLVDVKAPAALSAGNPVTINADMAWLVCKENCLRESQRVSVKLPTTADAAPTKANEEVFTRAGQMLPKSESAHLRVVPSVTVEQLVPGQPFELVLQLLIPDGISIVAAGDTPAGMQPVDIFVGPAESTYFTAPIFPPSGSRELKDRTKISEYSGRLFIRIPGQFEQGATRSSPRLEGVITFQPVDTAQGQMLDRETLRWEVALPGM